MTTNHHMNEYSSGLHAFPSAASGIAKTQTLPMMSITMLKITKMEASNNGKTDFLLCDSSAFMHALQRTTTTAVNFPIDMIKHQRARGSAQYSFL
mmetsp:Transcript_37506/g.61716  ORF Transcript_37506/g.61716 Transcript_37506/m.61716 type:complete len:95 (+) Transcript_37506:582-866(+)